MIASLTVGLPEAGKRKNHPDEEACGLVSQLGSSVVFHDSFYRPDDLAYEERCQLNYDHWTHSTTI